MRILVIGASGAGKSTLARSISQAAGLPYVPTDHFYWQDNWQPAPEESVVEAIDLATSAGRWVLDGNFDDQRHLVWSRATTVVWLDLPGRITVARTVRRNLRYLITREPMWSGNRMNLRRFWSGVHHSLRSLGKKRRLYPAYLAQFPHLEVVRLRSPAQVKEWLAGFRQSIGDRSGGKGAADENDNPSPDGGIA